MNKKEHVICELQMDFKKCFCCNDDIISVLCKLVMLRVKTGVENDIFWSKIGSGFGESGSTSLPPPPPHKKTIPRSTIPGSQVVENQVGRVSLQKTK